MGEYTVDSSGAHCKCVGLASGGATPSSPTRYGPVAQEVERLSVKQQGELGASPSWSARYGECNLMA